VTIPDTIVTVNKMFPAGLFHCFPALSLNFLNSVIPYTPKASKQTFFNYSDVLTKSCSAVVCGVIVLAVALRCSDTVSSRK
jgi:hypothetical protein